MSKPSFPNGPLRLAMIAILLVTIVAVATIGYSLYQVVFVTSDASDSPAFSGNIDETLSQVNGSLVFHVSGPFPNHGLYPVSYCLFVNATADGQSLDNATSPVQTIQPGQTVLMNFSFGVDLFAANNRAASTLFYNGTSVVLYDGVRTSFAPFLALRVIRNTTSPIPAFLGNVTVLVPPQAANQPTVTVRLTFSDEQGVPVSYAMYGALENGANSTSIARGMLMPGQAGSAQLEFPSQGLAAGIDTLTLHTLAFGHDFVTELRVELP